MVTIRPCPLLNLSFLNSAAVASAASAPIWPAAAFLTGNTDKPRVSACSPWPIPPGKGETREYDM